jgi:hypothetical protein
VAVVIAILTKLALKEPERKNTLLDKTINEDNNNITNRREKVSLVKILFEPRFILFTICASIRHCAGLTFAYNADLYFRNYFPQVDLGWWLFLVTVGTGCFGVIIGGYISDKLVTKYGIKSRVICLAVSQLLATPPAAGALMFDPKWAILSLAISNCFGESCTTINFKINVTIVFHF